MFELMASRERMDKFFSSTQEVMGNLQKNYGIVNNYLGLKLYIFAKIIEKYINTQGQNINLKAGFHPNIPTEDGIFLIYGLKHSNEDFVEYPYVIINFGKESLIVSLGSNEKISSTDIFRTINLSMVLEIYSVLNWDLNALPGDQNKSKKRGAKTEKSAGKGRLIEEIVASINKSNSPVMFFEADREVQKVKFNS